MSAWELTNIISRLVLPPGGLILLALIGIALARSRARFGTGLALFSLIALYALATPIVARELIRSLQPSYVDPASDSTPGAIVILTGGVIAQAQEYGTDTASEPSLARARYGMHLQRRTGKPILVTGGNPAGYTLSEAEAMKEALRDLGASVKWVEGHANNTFDSAQLSSKILRKAGVESIYLVTHAWHMPRARMAFERVGLHVVPAPMESTQSRRRFRVLDFMPSVEGLQKSERFFHEILGLLWYRLRFDLAS